LRAALEILRQLLCQAELDPKAGCLRLPAVALEDAGPAPAILLDAWRLPPSALEALLEQLRQWRCQGLYVPLPEGLHTESQQLATTLRRLFELRLACKARELEITPVLTVDASESLDTDRLELLAEVLAQFQGTRTLAVRFRDLGRSRSNSASCRSIRAHIEEVQGLAFAAGLGHSGAVVEVWLPSSRVDLIAELGSLSKQPHGPRLAVAVEAESMRPNRLRRSAAAAAAHGIPARLVVLDGSSGVPPFVWPEHSVRERAVALVDLFDEAQNSGLRGVVVEVPVHRLPWCGLEAAPNGRDSAPLHGDWCRLTAFLAAGLGRRYRAARRPLVGEDDVKADRPALGTLLAAHLLQAWSPSSSSQGIAPVAELALWLWDGPAMMPPPGLLQALVGLLEGRLPWPGGPPLAESLAHVNEWHHRFSDRRNMLRAQAQKAGLGQSSGQPSMRPGMLMQRTWHSALTGAEWLRFACRLFLLLARHSDAATSSEPEPTPGRALLAMRNALRKLPPTKGSDVRNSFLRLAEHTVSSRGPDLHVTSTTADPPSDEEEDSIRRTAMAQALWQAGLRAGAALELQPWAGLADRELAGGVAVSS